ncbi:MAG: GDP-mannose 4,6-dehydratase, partial [Armatimonadetes bacterium]|nr:GDP-mannose 4,6-dehydratase [Armatimonadota bacterium]
MKKVLLTGAVGFIGSHLSELLLNAGYEVIGYDNFDPFYPRSYKELNLKTLQSYPRFTFVEADLRDRAKVMETIEQHRPNGIIHLAAKAGVRPSIQDPVSYTETNVTGTLNLLLACEKYPVEHFTFASSSSVYGNNAKVPFSEDDQTSHPESPYAATKKAGELLCYSYYKLLKLPITCLRFFTVYGPRQRPDLAIHKFVKLIDNDEPIPFFGDGCTS